MEKCCNFADFRVLEWQKQMAIRAVKPMEMRDDEKNIDKSRQSEKVSITAYFERAMVTSFRKNYIKDEEHSPVPIGICFEGIRVSSNTPGYRGETFLVMMNSCNNRFVKTDVARSSGVASDILVRPEKRLVDCLALIHDD